MNDFQYPITITIHHEKKAVDAPYIAYIPEFDISSCGKTEEKAVHNAKEALELLIDVVKKNGDLDYFLEELGIQKTRQSVFSFPKIVIDRFNFSFPV